MKAELIKKGGILISVHCDDSNWTHKAKSILQETGAEDVSSTGRLGLILRRAINRCHVAACEVSYSGPSMTK